MIKEEKWRKGGVDEFTLFWSIEFHIELLHAIIDHLHFIVTHHPSSHKSNPRNQKNPKKKKLDWAQKKEKTFIHMNSEKLQFHQIHFSAFAWRRHFIFWEFGERERWKFGFSSLRNKDKQKVFRQEKSVITNIQTYMSDHI